MRHHFIIESCTCEMREKVSFFFSSTVKEAVDKLQSVFWRMIASAAGSEMETVW